MGNAESIRSEFDACRALLEIVRRNEFGNLLARPTDSRVVDVDLGGTKKRNDFAHQYIVELVSSIPSRSQCNIVILFPQHPVHGKRAMHSANYRTHSALNNELNDRLRESQHSSFSIICGERFYRICNAKSTMYLAWAASISVCSVNRMNIDRRHDIPLLIEMDGFMHHRSITMFESRKNGNNPILKPTDIKYVQLALPFGEEFFVCEARRDVNDDTINTLTENKLQDYLTTPQTHVSSDGELSFDDAGGELILYEDQSKNDNGG